MPHPAANFDGSTPVPLTGNITNATANWAFQYANDTVLAAGSYGGINTNNFGVNSGNVSGIVNKNDVYASAYVDFPFGRWVPYIGGGIGYTNLSTPSVWRSARSHAAAKVEALSSNGMDEIEIPAFLRKQAD